ncbi:DNA primase, large subunit [Pholiota conissans]|uniref:DNA primase large subunit n=1 Tax=Pholiota conissans TaxID=109636 RepID=A0A9P5ZA43_9AGAR|nr:DNA primase, large subunit [Pholiota conissans]
MYKASTGAPNDTYRVAQVANHGLLTYPHRLNFYDAPPLFEVTAEEFETSAIHRLHILSEIETSAARNRTWDELKKVTAIQCDQHLPLGHNIDKTEDLDGERRRDYLSHFVLRLAFCRSEDLRQRFVKAETTLFKLRYESDLINERASFLNSRDFNWIPVDATEQKLYAKELNSPYFGKTEAERLAEKYYKVKWTRVPDLVERRKVFVKKGWAYVPSREQSSIVFHEFETHLQRALEMTAKLIPRLDEDTRLIPVLDNLSRAFLNGISSEWTSTADAGNSETIKAEQVDSLAKKHFPLCMRTLHDNLQRDNHLKHFGRLQYGLFLKVLGLSVEEAIVFWRKSFSRIADDKFNKEYKYNIRHSYGLEGKRANYPAKSCQQLLTPGTSDHGCPYRNYSPENLQTALLSAYSSQGLRSSDLPEIMSYVKSSHYHVACTRVFELTHSTDGISKGEGLGGYENVIHPNEYAARSIALAKMKEEKVKEEPMVVE